MWVQVTTAKGDREVVMNDHVRINHAAEDRFFTAFKQKFARVEIHMTSAEFKRPITHAWISFQVLPRLGRTGELRLEVTPR